MEFLGHDTLSLKANIKKKRQNCFVDHCPPPTRGCSTTAELAGFGWNPCQRVDEPCFFSTSSIPSHCSNSLSTSLPWPRQGSTGSGSGDEDISTSMSFGVAARVRENNHHRCRRWVLRTIQIGSIALCAVGIITLVINFLVLQPRRHSHIILESGLMDINSTVDEAGILSTLNIYESLRAWTNPDVIATNSSSKPSTSILDIPNFYFLVNNPTICSSYTPTNNSTNPDDPSEPIDMNAILPDKEIYFMVLVHSAPGNFNERQSIRSTWGSVKSLKHVAIRLVFLLGQPSNQTSYLGSRIRKEHQIFNDIVSGSFEDNYRNLSYKHIMGYKWAVSFCPRARFILKTDDDAFIDIFQLFEFVTSTYGFEPSDTLLCNVYPEGTKPVRGGADPTMTTELDSLKWKVTSEEYPFDIYPKYCGGLAYLITPDLISRILAVSDMLRGRRFFWIDDVFVTGVLRELAKKEPFYLNLRYAYDPDDYRGWLDDRSPERRMRRIPFMIVHVERGPNFSEEMSWLWRKTIRVWSPH